MSRYRKIEVKTWSDEKFRRLTPIPPSGQGLWFFLLTGPHTGPIPGLFRAGRAAMAEELGWELEAFDEAFGEVSEQGMAVADFKAKLVWLPNAIKHNKPESPNVIRSWSGEFDLLPECELKAKALSALGAYVSQLGEGFVKAFRETFGESCGKPLRKSMPNQEQEQEQEQEEEIITAASPPTCKPASRETRDSDPDWLLEFKLAYPARAGDQGWRRAVRAANERMREGHTPAEFIAGARRYAAFCESTGKVGTEYVKQAATFLGPDKAFLFPWSQPATRAEIARDTNVRASQAWLSQQECVDAAA